MDLLSEKERDRKRGRKKENKESIVHERDMTFSTLSSSENENNTGFSSSAFGLKKVFVNETVQCGVVVRVVVGGRFVG